MCEVNAQSLVNTCLLTLSSQPGLGPFTGEKQKAPTHMAARGAMYFSLQLSGIYTGHASAICWLLAFLSDAMLLEHSRVTLGS